MSLLPIPVPPWDSPLPGLPVRGTRVLRVLLLLCCLLPVACSYNIRLPYLYAGDEGQLLQPGESAQFMFFTNDARADSGISLQAGADYTITIQLLSNWSDGHIHMDEYGQPLGLLGFSDTLMGSPLFNHFKRSGSHRWFELMLYQDNCPGDSLQGFSQLSLDSATGTYSYRAVCSGKLSFHVNDAWGFYNNNAGMASIAITRN